MYKQIDRCEDETKHALTWDFATTLSEILTHRQQRHDEICCKMRERCCEEDMCLLLLCRWLLVCGSCVCVFLYGDHRERQKRVEKLNICALRTYVGVGLFAWSHLNSRFCAFNSLRFTSKRQKETDTKICIHRNVFVMKRIFSQRLASKPVLTHVRGKQELIEAHYSDVLQTSQRLNQISGWASLTSAAVCSLPLRSNLMATLARDSS